MIVLGSIYRAEKTGLFFNVIFMLIHNYILDDDLANKMRTGKSNFICLTNNNQNPSTNIEFIRFEEKKERYVWAHPDEIFFGISADHYVRTLINNGNKMKWMTRHSTLKEMLAILPAGNFIRLNKFYLVNLNYFSHINKGQKLLYFINGSSISIPHRISPFLSHLLKSNHT